MGKVFLLLELLMEFTYIPYTAALPLRCPWPRLRLSLALKNNRKNF